MVYAWLPPYVTMTVPDGVMVPPVPAVAVIVYVLIANVATIVWLVCTFVNV